MSGMPISGWGSATLGAAAKARLAAQRAAEAEAFQKHQRRPPMTLAPRKRKTHPAGQKSRKGFVRLATPIPGNVRSHPRRKGFACAAQRGQRMAQRIPLATLR